MSVGIDVPLDGPLFEGHFPGRPILPGVALLALVARALDPEGSEGLSEIPFARFRGLVQPGDRLDADAKPRGGAGVRFDIRRMGEVVANGAMTFGPSNRDGGRETVVAARVVRDAPAMRELIPHRPPMLFVESLLGEADDGATCLGRVPSTCALATGGVAPTFVALEAAAQTAAIWEALRRRREGGAAAARTGYLVSLRDVLLLSPTIPTGADLYASVRLSALAPPLATYDVEVSVLGALALTGTIGTYLSD